MFLRIFFVASLLSLLLVGCSTTTHAPVYGSTPAGTYRVQKGDTLYQIAKRHRTTVSALMQLNQMKNPNSIEVGQLLRITSTHSKAPKPQASRESPHPRQTPPTPTSSVPPIDFTMVWPAQGKVIASFNGTTNKGINIAGQSGSPILAAGSGKVVYAGTGIRTYGNLIIIKHNTYYLTAYAHNQQLLVKEGQTVKTGEKIATMGNTGTNTVMLHFELRRQGNAINPMPYLAGKTQ